MRTQMANAARHSDQSQEVQELQSRLDENEKERRSLEKAIKDE